MSNSAEQTYKEFGKSVDKNTRSIIIAKIDHNGDAVVNVTGEKLDITFLNNLIDVRIKSVITGETKFETKEVKNESPNNKD